MYLKRLELLGFKSFANKTVIDLDRGMTAVVGPNGSGKSNVVDAVRWALGEQSLKAIRSRKSDEVIFAGNGKRAAIGMAEVTLVLDNSENDFPLPFAEVSVTRRQYRSGEGEYLINRSRARLRDVVELLSHASLGPDAYAVVNQGAVDEVLLQRPEDRRALLEAAADISRHQAKLRESLDKLSETESNIRRVEDIRGEIGPRLAKLKSQANRARRYEEYVTRLRTMVLWRYVLQIRQLRGRLSADLELEGERAAASTRAGSAFDEVQQQAAGLRQQLRQAEAALEAAKERLASLRLARATAEREAALLLERERSYQRQLEEAREELSRAQKERQELQAEMAELDRHQAEWRGREKTLRDQIAPIEAERRQIQSEERYLRSQLDRAIAEQRGGASRRSELQERRNALSREASRIVSSQAESVESARQSAARLDKLESELATARAALNTRRDGLSQMEASHKELQERLKAAVVELEAARRKEREAWQRDNDLRNKLGVLQSLKEQHRGLSGGARAILDAGLPGIRGTLASMIRVPEEYVVALSAALGSAEGYVISEAFGDALEALQLAARRSANATVAPLRLEKRSTSHDLSAELKKKLAGALEDVGFRGLASDLVTCPPEARDLCARYLGLSLVVQKLEGATDLYRRLGEIVDGRIPYQIVTMDGMVLRSRGEISFAQGREKDGGLLARDAELAALSRAADEASEQLRVARETVAGLELAHSGLSSQVSSTNSGLAQVRRQIENENSSFTELASQVAKIEAAIEWHRTRGSSLDREAAQNRAAVAKVEKDLADLEAKRDQSGSVVDQLQSDLAGLQSSTSDCSVRLARLQSELSGVQNRLREFAARASAFSDAARRADERVHRQEDRVAQLSRALNALAPSTQAPVPPVTSEDIAAAEKTVTQATSRSVQVRQQVDAAETEIVALTRTKEAAGGDLAAARSRLQRTAVELGMVLREASREGGMGMEDTESETADELLGLCDLIETALDSTLAESSPERLPQTLTEVSSRADSLRKELQAIGTINADAPEEYKQLSERFSFMADQLEDLGRADRTLRSAITELRELMETRFQETFNLVNTEFGRCFTMLFGGGTARLALTQPDHPLAGGVDVIATLPGKKTSSLIGFSGGERALTAVALLFALMKVNPSPFCLLDEVDAALDESNVRRFCEMLKGLSGATQFMVITHNRTTMEMAGALYGVSMLSDSTSRVMSLRLNGHERDV